MTDTPPIRRILVGLDASPGSMAALKASAHMAALLQAELLGLYVEDESLLRGADISMTQLVGSFSGSIRPINRHEVEQTLRIQARRARQALESVAGHAQVRWSFRVARGPVENELIAASTQADMIGLGRCGWSLVETRYVGRTSQAILARTGTPVLLLPRNLRPGSAIVTVYDGSMKARTGLGLAVRLAREDTTPLVIVVPGPDHGTAEGLAMSAKEELQRLDIHRAATYRRIPRMEPATLAASVGAEGIGILILPENGGPSGGSLQLLAHLDVPVLVVR